MSRLVLCKECGNTLIPFNYEIKIKGKIHELQGMKCSSSSCDYKFPEEAKSEDNRTK
jgi:RNase P subunit RPR2